MCFFLSTSKKVRNDMKCRAVSDTGDKWSVGLDDRLDSTLKARAATIVYRKDTMNSRPVRSMCVHESG